MVNQRSVALGIILTIITLGLYGIYWFIVMTNDVGRLSGDPSFTGGKHFLLTLITCGIWGFIWAYQLGKHIEFVQRQRGQMPSDNSLIYILLYLFGLTIVIYGLGQAEINKLA